jgi:hypothetical protein
MENTTPILSMLVEEMFPENTIRLKTSNTNLMENLVNRLQNNKKDLEVFLLKLKPDEIVQNKPREIQAAHNELSGRIKSYRRDILKIADNVKETKHLSDILLRTQLPKTMWGSKGIQKTLSNIQEEMQNSINIDNFEFHTERAKNASEFLDEVIYKNARLKKEAMDELVKNISNNFFQIKRVIGSMAQNLYALFDIDKTFKKATGYPATWFFDSSIFYDFKYNFENLVKSMIRCARLEADVIGPLFVWKVKATAK